jgi:hypothetical protein
MEAFALPKFGKGGKIIKQDIRKRLVWAIFQRNALFQLCHPEQPGYCPPQEPGIVEGSDSRRPEKTGGHSPSIRERIVSPNEKGDESDPSTSSG